MTSVNKNRPPQHSLLFRVVAAVTKLQFRYLMSKSERPRLVVMAFVFIAGATALGTITLAAIMADFPLLFPPLGPSAFILFSTPMSDTASPRSVILSHTMAVVAGVFSMRLVAMIFPGAAFSLEGAFNLYPVIAIALAMGLTSIMMITIRSSHPPAAASALIAAMGFLDTPRQFFGIIGAVLFLVLEAVFFNRILGGLPYPLWRANPNVIKKYGLLAGIPESGTSYWRQLAARTFAPRDQNFS